MAFDFLGTFNKSQFDRLVIYAKAQLPAVQARLLHLTAEQLRIGSLVVTYDSSGKPKGYTAQPQDSRIGKLLGAYEVLGGDVFYDLQVRPKSNPVYLQKADEASAPKLMSNGEPLPQVGLADAASANLMLGFRAFMEDPLERRAYLERKIRRAIDYADQLQEEIEVLQAITRGADEAGSLDAFVNAVNQLFTDPNYRAIGDDGGKDPFGKYIRAPFASYEPGPDRGTEDGVSVERTATGYSISGQQGAT